VADTFNHRIAVLSGVDGHWIRSLGHAPSIRTINKVVVDAQDRVFAVDSDSNHVLAFLGAGVPAPFDPYMRDYIGDVGNEPSDANFIISSPDILVRHQADINITSAAILGLNYFRVSRAAPWPKTITFMSRCTTGAFKRPPTISSKLYYYDPNTPGVFPTDYQQGGLYSHYFDSANNTPSNTLAIGVVPPSGVTVAGPLIWRPPHPTTTIGNDGELRLAARAINPFDAPPAGSATTARDYNSATERRVTVAQGPFPTGVQNTLFVRVRFSDKTDEINETIVLDRAAKLADWVEEVSWGEATVNLLHRGPVILNKPTTYYYDPSNNVPRRVGSRHTQ
jgi:hypothetical protein